MDFKEGRTGEGTNYNTDTEIMSGNLSVKAAPEYEDVEGEQAFGVYSGNTLLGVFWNEEFANIFKSAMNNVEIKLEKG